MLHDARAPPACQERYTTTRYTMNPEDLQLLLTREMPFGKYKGRCIADLPGDYLRWFVREGVPKNEIGRLINLMHEIDHNGLSDLLKPLREFKRQKG
jgi:uncharacterized protein (DUF3820 family)